jgi:hypothetical protein
MFTRRLWGESDPSVSGKVFVKNYCSFRQGFLMVEISKRELRSLDDAFAMSSGYVLNFSDRSMAEWFEDNLRVDIDDARYKRKGTSKANRLRVFVLDEAAPLVTRMMRLLWDYREKMPTGSYRPTPEQIKQQKTSLFDLIEKIEGNSSTLKTDALEVFTRDETLDELVQAIRREADANKPQAALDRLHTYSMKKFSHLLELHGAPTGPGEALHSRVGRYIKLLETVRPLTPTTKLIMRKCIVIFQSYNDIRNNSSFAHDNIILDNQEARFIFETVISMLRFVKDADVERFEAI